MAMATIGVLVILFVVFDNWEGITAARPGLFGIPRSTTVWSALVFAVVTIAICRLLPRVEPGPRAPGKPYRLAGRRGARGRTSCACAGGPGRSRALLMGMGGGALGPVQHRLRAEAVLLRPDLQPARDARRSAASAPRRAPFVGAFVVTAVFELMRRIEERIDVPGITQIVVATIALFRRDGLMGPSRRRDARCAA